MIEKKVIFTAPLAPFKDAKPTDKPLSEIYVTDLKGGLCGGLYTPLEVKIGDTVIIDLGARDGKARLKIVEVRAGK